jgi:predicted enzyme related to lactoylglutathione lyase
MAKVEHFEIPAGDVARATAFYETVFGWTTEAWDEDNVMISPTGDGIGGDIHKREALAHPTFVVTVDRIEDTIAAIEGNGGRVLGAIQPLGENSRWVYVEDCEGNTIGLYDEAAPTS